MKKLIIIASLIATPVFAMDFDFGGSSSSFGSMTNDMASHVWSSVKGSFGGQPRSGGSKGASSSSASKGSSSQGNSSGQSSQGSAPKK